METNEILKADLLDIIFDRRNKDYGAYELRKTYSGRMMTALASTAMFFLLISGGYVLAQPDTESSPIKPDVPDVRLVDLIDPPPPPQPPLPPPPPPPAPPQVQTIIFSDPVITNEEVRPEEKLPDLVQLADSRIGDINQTGMKDDDVIAPPVPDNNRGITEAPKKIAEDKETVFIRVEVESVYPGGTSAWMRYLNRTFKYPSKAQEEYLEGTVTVQFIVDTEGTVSNVEAVSGPVNGGLREEAIRVIKGSGKWEPAIQNGRRVKSYKKQAITFKLQSE